MLRAQFQTVVSLIYPHRCLGCGDLVEQGPGLCGSCWRDCPFITGAICDSCGTPLPGEIGEDLIQCDGCLRHPPIWNRGRAALLYQGGARKLVLGLKHGDRTELADVAGRWMLRAADPLLKDDPLLCPVPLHWFRYLRRRYNQSALLAQAMARQGGLDCLADLLHRPRATPSLDGHTRAERQAVLDGAITLSKHARSRISGRHIVIVDDVMTSGATLTACTHACLIGGARDVSVVVLARVTAA